LKKILAPFSTQPAPIRIGAFILILLLLWLPFAALVQWLVHDQNLVSLLTMPWLYLLFLGLVWVWGKAIHGLPQIFQHYGMRSPQRWIYDWMGGLGIGYGVVLLLFELQGAIGWMRWHEPIFPVPKLLLEGLVIASIVALAEELFFRGWLLDELERDYKPNLALGVSSFIYALAHCLRLAPASIQIVALTLLGLSLGLAKRITRNRLGLSIGIHTGLVWCYYVLNVGRFTSYTWQVPVWVTGFERNPLAGVLGVVVMGILFGSFVFSWQRTNSRA
jgi:uncharacterized protein